MITLQELCSYLESFLEISAYKDYCENGLQVEGKKQISKIATAVSANLATIQEAVHSGVDALIVHHGLFWQGDPYAISGPKKEKLLALLNNNISLLCYHLPLDGHRTVGNNWLAAKELQWRNLEPFGEYRGTFLGVKGTFDRVPVKDFQQKMEAYYSHVAHAALGGEEFVESAALVSGGAYKLLSLAAAENVDCFVTGNFDEPAYYEAQEKRINFFALGHHNTETVGPRGLSRHLQETFAVPCAFIQMPNPF